MDPVIGETTSWWTRAECLKGFEVTGHGIPHGVCASVRRLRVRSAGADLSASVLAIMSVSLASDIHVQEWQALEKALAAKMPKQGLETDYM